MSFGWKVAIATGKIFAYFVLLGLMAAGGVEMVLPRLGLSLDKPGLCHHGCACAADGGDP
jgi:hypothetical protein